MDWREQMAFQVIRGHLSVSDAARAYEVSRPTVRLWRDRYLEGGRGALEDRSHAPRTCPHRISEEIEELVLAERRIWGFGSKKIKRRIRDEHDGLVVARSTIDAILLRHNLTKQIKRRTKTRSPFARPVPATHSADVNTMDFKGQFRMMNGRYCFPLTIMDPFSRYLLACKALEATSLEFAWPVIERVFRKHGLPRAVHTDNGPPFGPPHGRISTLSVRLMKLGVQPVFSRPGKPQDNGSHERMHRDLKARTTRPPERDLAAQQKSFNRFQRMYNFERPHEGIELERPASLYKPSPRPYPKRIAGPEYPEYFEKRQVDNNGVVKWRHDAIFLAEALRGQTIGLEPTEDQIWRVSFYGFYIATLDEEQKRFI